MKSGNVDGVPPSLSPPPSLNAANINDAARVVRMGGAAKEGEKREGKEKSKIFWSRAFVASRIKPDLTPRNLHRPYQTLSVASSYLAS